MKQQDNIPIKTIIGVVMFGIGGLLIYFNRNLTGFLLYLSVILFYLGLLIAIYGLAKIKIKGDKNYEKFIRKYFKFDLMFFIFLFIFVILALTLLNLGFSFSFKTFIIFIVLYFILLTFLTIRDWIFYFKTYKYLDKSLRKSTKEERRKQIIFCIILIIVGLSVYYLSKKYG